MLIELVLLTRNVSFSLPTGSENADSAAAELQQDQGPRNIPSNRKKM